MQMHGVTDPNHQLIAVGWENGTLRCRWRKGEGEHTGVPEDLFLKLRRVPFAYRQYNSTIKGKFPYTKIEDPPEESNGRRENRDNQRGNEEVHGRGQDSVHAGNIQNTAGRDRNGGVGGNHLQGRYRHGDEREPYCKDAYTMADAMLAAREDE